MKFKDKKEAEVSIDVVDEKDLNSLITYINGLITENTFIYRDKDSLVTFDEEKLWLDRTMQNMKDGAQFYVVAKLDGKIIGSANIERGWMRERETGTFRFSVSNDYRDRGIGTKLVETGIRMAKEEMSLKTLISWIFADDEKAIYLAKKMGFVEAGRLPESVKYKDGYTDQILVYLSLDKIYNPQYGTGNVADEVVRNEDDIV